MPSLAKFYSRTVTIGFSSLRAILAISSLRDVKTQNNKNVTTMMLSTFSPVHRNERRRSLPLQSPATAA